MQLRQLRYFLAVVEYGSFSRAAEALGRTQQALSKGIQALEESVGVRLLDRNSQAATPTVFGRLLLGPARTVEVELRGFREHVAQMLGAEKGDVRIGVSPTAAGLLVAEAVTELRQRRPGVGLAVLTGIYQDLLPMLLRGELDMFVSVETVEADGEAVVREVLCHEDYGIVAAAGHPLASLHHIGLTSLVQWPWLRGLNLGIVEQALRECFVTAGLQTPEVALETDSLELIRQMLLDGDYLCLLPRNLLSREIASGLLVVLDTGELRWSRPISLYYRRGLPPGPAALALVDALHGVARRRAA